MSYETKTKAGWLEAVSEHRGKLRELIAGYHPSARKPAKETSMPITAPAAERACNEIRREIREEHPEDPLREWDRALADGDVGKIMSLLEAAWFGVPESTSCWQITGFKEAVDLMDDPPDEGE
jgi:hypothetical protein